jgi:hypothetical protein
MVYERKQFNLLGWKVKVVIAQAFCASGLQPPNQLILT